MQKEKSVIIFIAFIIIWLIINSFQAGLTGLLHDEAYYFLYSEFPAWGYYDHPPLTAMMIKAGTWLFHGEFGLRVLFVLLSAGTIGILYLQAKPTNIFFFALLFFSFLFFQITGFLALPDSAMIFFTALFFLVYKKFTEKYDIRSALLLGTVMAGLFYSKYLGIVVIFFTVLSNLNLFRKGSFWLAVAITTILLLPHLLWQYHHDFPTFYYHLTERSHDEYFRWTNFLDYLVGQAGLINPILFIPVIWSLFRFKPGNTYEKALKFSAAGSLLLPFLLMLKGRVEANWTMAGLLPLFLVTFIEWGKNRKMVRFATVAGLVTILLIISARVFLMADFLPEKYTRMVRLEMIGWKTFSKEVEKIAGDRPVVFIGGYQIPSLYRFYTGKEAFSFNNALYRNNQYDLEDIEAKLQGRKVLLLFPRNTISPSDLVTYGYDSIMNPNGRKILYTSVDDFRSYNWLRAEIIPNDNSFKAGTEQEFTVILNRPVNGPLDFSDVKTGEVFLTYLLLQQGKPVQYRLFENISQLGSENNYQTSFRMTMPEKPGIYYMKVSLKTGILPPGINSRLVKIKVE
ncbi:MAG TPA: glycosyltransferase family 39 protein [Bacteroidales bacterium]|nr:glycosyltransferase family 39 protein [Bacteroidales bacterium]HPI85218.1 glycosyltransferase family 39 protein [Bacteroidales bacterium]HPM93104.1 glycosyltransferase family 39 protein [Bacteroidales bacterium]